jgi:hypothetical protein
MMEDTEWIEIPLEKTLAEKLEAFYNIKEEHLDNFLSYWEDYLKIPKSSLKEMYYARLKDRQMSVLRKRATDKGEKKR